MIKVNLNTRDVCKCIHLLFPPIDAERSRLLTVTIDGRLDIWDFDATKHIIYKDKSVPNKSLFMNNTAFFDTAFDLVGTPLIPGICMVLTSKNIMVNMETLRSMKSFCLRFHIDFSYGTHGICFAIHDPRRTPHMLGRRFFFQ